LQTLKVCHRDLKPDNFLVDEKEPEENLKEVSKSLGKEKHDEKSHVWLRICFGDQYYEY